MYFYVPFHFFKVSFDFACLSRGAFCKAKAHRGTTKGGKMSVLFFSNRMAIFHAFLRAISLLFHIFRVPFDFASVPKVVFCKSKAHWGSPKRRKNVSSFLLQSNGIFSFIFTCYFIFSKSLSILSAFQEEHFEKLKDIGVPPNEEKCHFLFSQIKWHFFMYFYVPFQKQHFARIKRIGVPQKEEKCQFFFL